jgi:hypothetical protein
MKIRHEESQEPSPCPLPSDGRGYAIGPVRAFLGPIGNQDPSWLDQEDGPVLRSCFCEGGSRSVTPSHGDKPVSAKARTALGGRSRWLGRVKAGQTGSNRFPKRQRTGALQDASRPSRAFWIAAVLCRFSLHLLPFALGLVRGRTVAVSRTWSHQVGLSRTILKYIFSRFRESAMVSRWRDCAPPRPDPFPGGGPVSVGNGG